MTRAEIKRKFDDIVEFSEIGRFLDTPVKRYSSGMYVRLAFAVASSLDPEILIVDEVLAVGDAEFQNKCLGKMEGIATSGRTVVFVSHNMGAVRALCTRCALLDSGRLVRVGDVGSVVDQYLDMGGASGTVFTLRAEDSHPSTSSVSVSDAHLLDVTQDGASLTSLSAELTCRGREEIPFNVEWRIVTIGGQPVVFGAPELFRRERLQSRIGDFSVEVLLKQLPLAAGRYRLELAVTQAFRRILDTVHLEFELDRCDPGGVGFDFRHGANWAAMFGEDRVVISNAVHEVMTGGDPSAD